MAATWAARIFVAPTHRLLAMATDLVVPLMGHTASHAAPDAAAALAARRAAARMRSVEPDGWSFMPLTHQPVYLCPPLSRPARIAECTEKRPA